MTSPENATQTGQINRLINIVGKTRAARIRDGEETGYRVVSNPDRIPKPNVSDNLLAEILGELKEINSLLKLSHAETEA